MVEGDDALGLPCVRICVVVSPRQSVICSAASLSDSGIVSTAIIGSGRPASIKACGEPLPHELLPARQYPALGGVIGSVLSALLG